ncbi:MAG TPA: MFS transporter [Acidobacteriaceae bacterium]|nr:MFS transporter [Acidobacteriaceae bacterium]
MPQMPDQPGTFNSSRAAWVALVLLSALNLLNYADRYLLAGVQPLVQQAFHLTDERIGALTFAFFITYMLAAPLTGWLGDRYARKPLILAGAFLWSLLTLSTALVHTYGELYLRHALLGIGEASFGIYAPALLSDSWPPEQRNRILTIFYLSLPVGAAMGYILGGTLGQAYGWRAPFYISAAPGLLIVVLVWIWMREPERGASEASPSLPLTPQQYGAAVLTLTRNPAYWTATLGMAMMVFAMGGIAVWMPTFLYRHGNYSLSAASQILGAITVVDGILGTWLGGWVAQRWLRSNRAALYLLSAWSVLLAAPFALFIFFGPRAAMVPCLAAAEFFLFLNTGPLNAAIVNAVSAPIRAAAIAIELFMIHALGDAPSPRIIGWISDHSSLRLGLSITLATLLVSGGLLFAGARFAPPVNATRT